MYVCVYMYVCVVQVCSTLSVCACVCVCVYMYVCVHVCVCVITPLSSVDKTQPISFVVTVAMYTYAIWKGIKIASVYMCVIQVCSTLCVHVCVCVYMYACDTGLFNSNCVCVHVCVCVCVCLCVITPLSSVNKTQPISLVVTVHRCLWPNVLWTLGSFAEKLK